MADRPGHAFYYHCAVAPMMWVLVGVASSELLVVHLFIAHWSRTAAIVLSVLTFGSVLWVIGVIRSFRRLPVLLTDDTLVLRTGTLKSITVALADIAGLRERWDGAVVKRRDVLNLALIAYPNVVVDLRTPRPGRRAITAVAYRLDEPAAFAAALKGATAAK